MKKNRQYVENYRTLVPSTGHSQDDYTTLASEKRPSTQVDGNQFVSVTYKTLEQQKRNHLRKFWMYENKKTTSDKDSLIDSSCDQISIGSSQSRNYQQNNYPSDNIIL